MLLLLLLLLLFTRTCVLVNKLFIIYIAFHISTTPVLFVQYVSLRQIDSLLIITLALLFYFAFQVVRSATGKCSETMTRKVWDVHAYVGQKAHVKLVDFSSGGWGHINFDDLKGDISCV